MEGKNFDVSITYPQYYWKVSIALRGCLEKFFIVLGNFYCKTSHFTQKKNAPYNKGTFDEIGFIRFLRKKDKDSPLLPDGKVQVTIEYQNNIIQK